MNKRTRKKVIIITSIIIIAIMLGLGYKLYKFYQPHPELYNSDQQYLAAKTIDLPNGSSIIVAQLDNTKPNIHGWIGANLTDLTPTIRQHLNYSDQYGVYVQDTLRESPAQTAGILPGDIIIKINNVTTQEIFTTISLIATLQPGNAYPFMVFRQGRYVNYTVTINEKNNFS